MYIRNCRWLKPLWLKEFSYHSLFLSKLSYGILVWGKTTIGNYKRLIILQNKISRILENCHVRTQSFHCEPYFTKHIILNANPVYYFKLAQIIYKNKLYMTRDIDSGPTQYRLRDKKLQTPRVRTMY